MMAEKTSFLRSRKPQRSLRSLHLPFDLVVEILCRVPVKHVLRLRCVGKSWNSLISGDSNFAKKHLRSSTSRHERHQLILSSLDSLVLLFPISSVSTSTVKQFSFTVTSDVKKRGYGIRASTCDGMVCVKIDDSSALLCNPSIGKFKILPPFIFPHQWLVQIFYTLAHDRFTNTYKIFAVDHLSRKIEVSVHTLGTDYWRAIEDDFSGPHLIPPGIFLNDSVHWLANAPPLIVSLFLENESFQTLSLPDVNSSFKSLGTLRGCLSLLSQRNGFSDVWIMKEYGDESSWTKLVTVPPVVEFCFRRFHGYTKALYISEDDKVLMECFMMGMFTLVVYDSRNNTFKLPKFHAEIECDTLAQQLYVESLISPDLET